MKKLTYLIAGIFILLNTNCNNEIESTMNEGELSFSSINASMAEVPTSRVHLENDKKVIWDINDKIGIYSDAHTTPISFQCIQVNDTKGTFTSENEITGNKFYAYYPYENSNIDGNTMKYTLSNNTSYVAKTYFRQCPMISMSTTNEFKFKHTCGILRFSITGTQRIQSLILEGNNNEIISGTGVININAENPIFSIPSNSSDVSTTITMSMDNLQLTSNPTDFYFIVPASEFTKGISLTINCLNNDQSITPIVKTTSKNITVSRSVIKTFSIVDTNEAIQEKEDERLYSILMSFYNATGGDKWTNNTNWGSEKPFNEWYGLTTNDQGQITSLALPNNNLTGYIPNEIGELTTLTWLAIGQNNLSKKIPETIGNLINLESLQLDSNNLYGSIPESICNLEKLKQLFLSNNRLSGELPKDIGNMGSLEWLDLGNSSIGAEGGDVMIEFDENGLIISPDIVINQISGEIPQSICNLKKLRIFSAICNQLSGTIPEELWSIPTLESVQLSGNYLTGELSPSIGNAKKLTTLWLSNNHLTGTIPSEIWELTNLEELYLGNVMGVANVQLFDSYQFNQFSGELSANISNLQKLRQFDVGSLQLTGSIPDELWSIQTLEWALMNANYFEGILSPNISNAKSLKQLRIGNNHLSGTIPDELYKLTNLEEFSIGNVSTVNGIEMDIEKQMNSISGDISQDISNFINLSLYDITNNNITGDFPEYFILNPKMKGSTPYLAGNRMSGTISKDMLSSENWTSWSNPNIYILPQQEGYGFTLDIYRSTDYSKDGEIMTLQQATIGKGIDIVLMGDGYSDRLITDGTYDNTMRLAMEKLFSIEPYKSFREYFNIYSVKVVSENEEFTYGASTALSCNLVGGSRIEGDDSKVFSYAQKAIDSERMNEASLIVILNSSEYAGTCYMYSSPSGNYGNGVSISYFPTGTDETAFEQLIHHEAAGHGFAKLGDEYAYETMGKITTDIISSIQELETYGWYKNIDFTNDPTTIKWNKFLSDPRYSNEKLGIYEGAYTYPIGVYRPTENSIMRDNTGNFNAPSREAIYIRINKLAYGEDWQYDYEKFVEYDAINLISTASRITQTRPTKPLHEPVVIKKSWKDAKSNTSLKKTQNLNKGVINSVSRNASSIINPQNQTNERMIITTIDTSRRHSIKNIYKTDTNN